MIEFQHLLSPELKKSLFIYFIRKGKSSSYEKSHKKFERNNQNDINMYFFKLFILDKIQLITFLRKKVLFY